VPWQTSFSQDVVRNSNLKNYYQEEKMKKGNIIFCILTLIFFTNCVSYNNKPIDITKIENGVTNRITDPSVIGILTP
jgi:hypothetical protein